MEILLMIETQDTVTKLKDSLPFCRLKPSKSDVLIGDLVAERMERDEIPQAERFVMMILFTFRARDKAWDR
jgi:hypothetical protein